MRVGLIGTGYWARTVHAASLAAHPAVEFIGVWGRDPARTADLSDGVGVRAYTDVDTLIDDVDALSFAVPPAVQADIAVRAARRRRHLLLEKPIATSMEDARRLEDAATEGNVASIVFFTRRFVPQGQAWLEQVRERGGWYFGRAETTVNIFVEGGPYAGSSWRREYGALWDIGPHALSQLVPVLGPVTSAMAGAGRGDQVHLILQHGEGRTSTASLTLSAPSAATGSSLYFDGEHGRETFASRPLQSGDLISAHQAALDALIDRAAQSDHGHPCDVHFGARVVDILDAARRSLASGCRVDVPGLGRDGAPV